jgi:archaemetzincin
MDPIKEVLSRAFHLEVRILKNTGLPQFALDPSRKQYHSTHILKRMQDRLPKDAYRALAVTSGDLFVPILRFVFGEAQIPGKCAVISLFRLNPDVQNPGGDEKTLLCRATKEAVHEIGHTFGLTHCRKGACVMHYSSVIGDTDVKSVHFCPTCVELIRWLEAKGEKKETP